MSNNSNHQSREIFELTINGNELLLTDLKNQQVYKRLPIETLTISTGGNNNKLVFINSSMSPNETIYFEHSKESLKYFTANSLLKEKLSGVFKKDRSDTIFTLTVAVVCVSLLFAFFTYRQSLFGSLAFLIPFELEKKVANQFVKSKLTHPQIDTLNKLKPILSKLKFDNNDWPHEFTFHITSETVPNAHATLGGNIFINKGLIVSVAKVEDLLGVVAHEMAHVQARHVVKSVVQAIGVYTILSLFVGDMSGIAAVILDQGAPLLNLQYSRELEDEADRLAIDLMIANNIDPVGLANSLAAIRDESKKLVQQIPGGDILDKVSKIEVLNSHPDIDRRIEEIKNKAKARAKNLKFGDLDFDFEKFKNEVRINY